LQTSKGLPSSIGRPSLGRWCLPAPNPELPLPSLPLSQLTYAIKNAAAIRSRCAVERLPPWRSNVCCGPRPPTTLFAPASRRLAACLGLGSGPQAFCVSAAATPTEGVVVTSQNHCTLTRSAFRCRPDRLWPSPRPRLKAIGQGFGRAGHDPARPGFTKPFAKEDPSSPAVHPQGGRGVARPMVR
jgi:hypothetical protein